MRHVTDLTKFPTAVPNKHDLVLYSSGISLDRYNSKITSAPCRHHAIQVKGGGDFTLLVTSSSIFFFFVTLRLYIQTNFVGLNCLIFIVFFQFFNKMLHIQIKIQDNNLAREEIILVWLIFFYNSYFYLSVRTVCN